MSGDDRFFAGWDESMALAAANIPGQPSGSVPSEIRIMVAKVSRTLDEVEAGHGDLAVLVTQLQDLAAMLRAEARDDAADGT
jgi:hypothetical protein